MARLLLERLAPGMRLNKPIYNSHGVLLLKEGEVLTEKCLQVFRTCEVREADVVCEDGSEPGGSAAAVIPREFLEAAHIEVGRRFRRLDPETDPVMAELRRVAVNREAQRRAAAAEDLGLQPSEEA